MNKLSKNEFSSVFVWNTVVRDTILFYDRGKPYFELTNFSDHAIVIGGKYYPTSEHFFQAQKLRGTIFEDDICKLPRPRQAFEYPRQPHVSPWIRHDWHAVKDSIMFETLHLKFTQHLELKKLLLETGQRRLVEHSPYDSYWGDGGDGNGLNRLGELLMDLRTVLRS